MHNFINPYNFVPFDKSITRVTKEEAYRDPQRQQELLTGWIDVDLFIKTPLIIPDGAHPKYWDISNDKEKELKVEEYVTLSKGEKNNIHKEYSFFKAYNPNTPDKLERDYSIPGSELRGLIRNVYETATNSCFPFTWNEQAISQRVPIFGALTRRGLLGYDNNVWVLYSTQRMTEEVIVVPVYKVDNKFYVESLNRVKYYKVKGKLVNEKYAIMKNIDLIERKLESTKVSIGDETEKSEKEYAIEAVITIEKDGKFSKLMKGNEEKAREISRKLKPCTYLFMKSDGTKIEKKTGVEVDYPVKGDSSVTEKRWIQYNVPVDTRKVYHVSYLKKLDEVFRWDDRQGKNNSNYYNNKSQQSEAYKKLRSALNRDGTKNKDNPNKQCTDALIKALDIASSPEKVNKYVPVYYFIVGEKGHEIAYLSGSAIGRIAQRRKWKEIINEHGPCSEELCPACLLFGTIRGSGMKGHVRVSDAFLNGKAMPQKHTISILSSPRTTAFEFYLKKPKNATYWNFDFYGETVNDSNGQPRTEYYHLEESQPRGRKMYWHHSPVEDSKKDRMNNTMEALENGSFSFKLYFDQINIEQLKDLIWSINLGDNNKDSKYQHKLGHAKPLGYGSVKLVVSGGSVRSFKNDGVFNLSIKSLNDIGIDVNNITPSFDLQSDTIKSLKKICDATALEEYNDARVDYPRLDENGKIFDWFSKNRTNANYLKILPEILNEDVRLNSEGFSGGNSQGNRQNKFLPGNKNRKNSRFDNRNNRGYRGDQQAYSKKKSETVFSYSGKSNIKEKAKNLKVLYRSRKEWDNNIKGNVAKELGVKTSEIEFVRFMENTLNVFYIMKYDDCEYLIYDSSYDQKFIDKELLDEEVKNTFKKIYKTENGKLVEI